MSPVGHSIVGLAFAAIAMPALQSRTSKLFLAAVFVAVANLPDWPIPNWGHDQYRISHSVFMNLTLIGIVGTIWLSLQTFRRAVPNRCLVLGGCAWLSHLVLDSFYNHGNGIAIYWPISKAKLNLAMPWFNNLDLSQPVMSQHNLSVFTIEFAAFSPLLAIALIVNFQIGKLSGKPS
jgi:hypothetical protein